MTGVRRRTRLAGLVCGAWCAVAVGAPAAEAAFPGQNGRIAVAKERHGNFDIYTFDAAGRQEARLTFDPEWDGSPTWSPDGKRIAFASGRDDPNGEIYVMNADGTGVYAVTTHAGTDTNPSWSPDGRRIVFETARQTGADIYTVNANGTGEAPIPAGGVSGGAPVWSPTGARIAYVCGTDYADICTVSPDGTNRASITGTPYGSEYSPDWSPDGTKIAYVGFADDIWVIDANGTNPRNVTQFCCGSHQPAWSPDGKHLLFATERCMSTDAFCPADFDIWTTGVDGSSTHALTANASTEFSPDWGPAPAAPRPAGTTAPAGTSGSSRRCKLRRYLPDRSCTPGATRKQASRRTVCRSGNAGAKSISAALAGQVRQLYGLSAATVGYEIDHLISRSLGGSDSIENLWPQRTGRGLGFRQKNRLERRLRAAVCAGKLKLKNAQRQIKTNWLRAYNRGFRR